MPEISPNQAYLQKLFEYYGLNPDKFFILQQTTEKFMKKKWDDVFNHIPKGLSKSKFLYVFVKNNNERIEAIYIGKSTTRNLNRLDQHLEGLDKFIKNPNTQSNQFYHRMFSFFFERSPKIPLFLYLFKWNQPRLLKNLFPFQIKFNLSNAEAGIVSDIAYKYPNSILNHEFVSRLKWSKMNLSLKKVPSKTKISINGNDPLSLWINFCEKWFLIESNEFNKIKKEDKVKIKLFENEPNSLMVKVLKRSNGMPYFVKSTEMKNQIVKSVKIVKKTYEYYSPDTKITMDSNTSDEISKGPLFSDGLLYMMYILRSDIEKIPEFDYIQSSSEYIPIYIGKTETLGRNGTFSRNLEGIAEGKNLNYFARWGYDDARHIGGLSLRFFEIPNKYPSTDYEKWIEIIFDAQKRKKGIPMLKVPVYFMMKPWLPYNISFCNKIGIFTPELETLLIALTRKLFPNVLGKKARQVRKFV